MKRVVVSQAADAALTDIYGYTEENRGTAQADHYVGGMLGLFDEIAAGSTLKRPIPPEFGVQGFVVRYAGHFVYWREMADGTIGIVAILPASMMQGERLRDAFGK